MLYEIEYRKGKKLIKVDYYRKDFEHPNLDILKKLTGIRSIKNATLMLFECSIEEAHDAYTRYEEVFVKTGNCLRICNHCWSGHGELGDYFYRTFNSYEDNIFYINK